MTWVSRAECRDVDPELFFPVNETVDGPQVVAAKKRCGECPVRAACLADALTPLYYRGELFYDVHGVRAGLTGAEREQLLRQRRTA